MSKPLHGLLYALRSASAHHRLNAGGERRLASASFAPPVLPFIAVANIVGLLAADHGWLRTEGAAALAVGALLVSLLVHSIAARTLLAGILFFALGVICLGARLDEAGRAAVRSGLDATVEGLVCSVRLELQRARFELCDVVPTNAAAPLLPSRLIVTQPLDASRFASRGTASSLESSRIRSAATPALGQRIRVRLRLRPVTGLRNPGSDADGRALLRRGIGARAWVIEYFPVSWPRSRMMKMVLLSFWPTTISKPGAGAPATS